MTLVDKDLKYIWHPCSQMKDYEEFKPIIIKRGQGIYLYDINGKSYADAVSSWWCNLLGHSNKRINKALAEQVNKIEHVIFSNFSNVPAIELCEKLDKLLPAGLEKFFFTDNGSAAVEACLKMSFHYHMLSGNKTKTKFMALTNAYHGETIGALSVTDLDIYSKMYKPLMVDVIRVQGPDCYRCKYHKKRESCQAECFEHVEKAIAEHGTEVASFIVEPLVQAAAGMKIYPPCYLKKLRTICTNNNIHLIADEIAVGYGRTGKMFACDHAGISPDMMCLSKGLSGGYMPLALAVTTKEIYNMFYGDYSEGRAFLHSHTYSGNAMGCAVAVEVLKILEEDNIIEQCQEKAKLFNSMIVDALQNHKYVGEIRSIGLINAIELVKDKQTKIPFNYQQRIGYQIYRKAVEKGLLLRPLGDVLYFNPPLITTTDDMKFMIDVCVQSINEVLK
ncbi:adenosylmethionine--8-amino-7-oxononanoate transaminase [Clostridium sp. 'deep sea']|uniref:adenosylmethionine--8-amino-7-oxononanoate transaminase n=1 Tax=Clostridium sp. 'deep sea' TaxID=2779445 RepID=UPI0018964ABE|nr:adenosylmethionine--8-amino-7-oxononanoate transaminase [Clostridium sp. 'deep sea']QOR35462.1 adenosylmethionine--8-amino-7-oxononanoate transaminase [Clostridium sp. 'deep sea']